MKKCGEIWNTLSADEKIKYEEMHKISMLVNHLIVLNISIHSS